jgi:DNA-binding response OmpR family regulator
MADWRLDLESRELMCDGRCVRLAEKPFLVLAMLLEAEGAVVTREALRQRLCRTRRSSTSTTTSTAPSPR